MGDDSGENFNLKHKSSLNGTSKKRKGRILNKKLATNKYRYNSSSSSKRKKRDFSSSFNDSRNHQSNFKSIQKGIENILNSDALFGEDQEKDKQNKRLPKELEEDDDSNDNFKLEKEEPETTGTCNKKKAKALINCFRSFAMKPK